MTDTNTKPAAGKAPSHTAYQVRDREGQRDAAGRQDFVEQADDAVGRFLR